jgi:hypothetical protein
MKKVADVFVFLQMGFACTKNKTGISGTVLMPKHSGLF